ncbi:MAG: chemotaxis protein CheA [Chloroflexia bacterium]|nr:chemotaxis protein CheA [Chloroflexia bacterium]
MEISQYLDLFVSEAQDHLQAMNQALLALEEQPEALPPLESLFRAAHTLKGMAATMGFSRMATLAHDVEDVLDRLRQRSWRLDPALADLLFRALDGLTALLQEISAGEGERSEIAGLQRDLQLCEGTPAEVPQAAAPAQPQQGWAVEVTIAPDCALKGPRAFLVWRRLSVLGQILGSEPPEESLRAGQYETGFSLFMPVEADPQALRTAAEGVAEVTAVSIRRLDGPSAQSGPVPETAPPPSPAVPAAATPLVRIKVDLLDRLLESVAGLLVSRSHVRQLARKYDLPDLDEVIEAQSQSVDQLQETVLAMRMVPVGQVFNRFPRMVRDLAQQQGKQVRLEMEGLELELDRTILEKITDPLVHLLRNAVDHGIELPEQRRSTGKTLPAHILLQAHREQDKAVVQLSDDGRGMSVREIAALALERGLLTHQQLSEMDEAAILELICRPGFSTSEQVSDVSGRGVGMEVVKTVLDEIGGTLEIGTQPGRGSVFRLGFPLTMAILPALLLRARQELYALPLTHIVRTVEFLPERIRWLQGQPLLPWEERLLPLVSLADLLGVAGSSAWLTPGMTQVAEGLTVIIVARAGQTYGLVVEEVLGKEEIVLKPLPDLLQQVEGLTGAAIRGEGEVVLVLDVSGLVRLLSQRVDCVNVPLQDM